ncbi:unnamed protein product [Symbiodinium sp. CCMP2592]|nr:unnamed protein product [Symbiodinium sp. CCMP2592]CAE7773085.1 unnamed protein product [Symbiodinium sp. CCMP2592]
MDTAPHEDSQAPSVETETDLWTVQDTVCLMMFEDPALLAPGRMVDLPAGFTHAWVVELLKHLPGPTEPHDLPGLRTFCGLGASQGETLDEAGLALQRLIVSYQDAAAAATAVLECESEVMTTIETQQKKADAIMKQLDMLCEKGKLSTEQVGEKKTAVKHQLQASTDALQNDLQGKKDEKCEKQLDCVDATLRLHELIMQKPVDAPVPESTEVTEPTGDVETAQDIDLESFEAELSAFLDPPSQSPVENTGFICVPPRVEKPDLDAPIFEPMHVVIDDDDDELENANGEPQGETPSAPPAEETQAPVKAKVGSAIQAALNRKTTIELEVTRQQQLRALAESLHYTLRLRALWPL